MHHTNYNNRMMMDLIAQANVEMDVHARDMLYRQVNRIAAAECAPMISLAQLENYESLGKEITGVEFTNDGFCFIRNIDCTLPDGKE